jgi:RNA polymerase sigma factor (sigma-70 family)
MEAKAMTAALTDEEIIQRVMSGEKQLYEHIIRKYNQRLYRICLSIVNEDRDIEDIMQNAYVNAYRQLETFKRKATFSTWLTRILINESLLWNKKRKRIVDAADTRADNKTPLKELMNKELKEVLEKAVSDLPEKYRTVFVMREVEDMSVKETMDVLTLTEANVKVRLNRAKEMLRDSLSGFYKSREMFEFNLVRCDRIVQGVFTRII